MRIAEYYRGGTDRITGHIFDTEKKTYKRFILKEADWIDKTTDRIKKGFKFEADIEYYRATLSEVENNLSRLISLGFTADNAEKLTFGIGLSV